jgi:catechol 2,3-dioxygenase-like lactoylglutathione lyase family enzyme
MMLSSYNCAAFLPASDLARARTFYSEKLGFEPLEEPEGMDVLFYQSGSTQFAVYLTQFAGMAQHTLMSWDVPDLDSEM